MSASDLREPASSEGAAAPREKTFLLARPEQRLLEAIARRVPPPARARPLDGLALAAAVAFAVAAASGHFWARRRAARRALARRLARRHARAGPARRAPALRLLPRPPRGRRRDRAVGLGLGLSAHMHLWTGLVLVIAYLALSINSYLETQALGRFSLGYGRLGPTEARLGLIALLRAVGAGVDGLVARAHVARPGRAGRRRRRWASRCSRARAGTCACSPSASPTRRRSAPRAGPPPRTPRACGRTGRRARSPSRSTARAP